MDEMPETFTTRVAEGNESRERITAEKAYWTSPGGKTPHATL
jgi:hypothetical protein